MITEAMITKGLAYIGAYTVSTKVILPLALPVTNVVGNLIGRGIGKVMVTINGNGRKTNKRKVEVDRAKEQAIIALLAECDQALAEKTEEVIEEPKPQFDQATLDWVQKCKDQYGGFAKFVPV